MKSPKAPPSWDTKKRSCSELAIRYDNGRLDVFVFYDKSEAEAINRIVRTLRSVAARGGVRVETVDVRELNY